MASGSTVLTAAQPPHVGDLGQVATVMHGGRLHRGTGGDDLLLVGDLHATAGQVGDDVAVGRAVYAPPPMRNTVPCAPVVPRASAPASRL